ncbi:hypothetical protein C4K04_1024 [Pseudomonas chlororaphis]|uniref:Disulfide bond formation protein B n=1 Tax=Pseudomonas chlororaphis TaxID=587753 RepID=A0A3G7TKH4_9PSED|nr:disulfide bond formation protein B [Pseudomonas chlororaphis]AZE46716.1 hypothetical protein C4K04_1024 [Pseudomonas chlororaphis]
MTLRTVLDSLAIACSCICLVIAFYFQLWHGELPCAMCNLERVSFIIFAGALLMNVRANQPSAMNYVIAALGALIGSLVSLLQMFVHVLPGTPATGGTFFGLHMYFIAYIALTVAAVYGSLMGVFGRQLDSPIFTVAIRGRVVGCLAAIFIALTCANLVSSFLENGFHPMKAGGQKHYEMLYSPQ